MPPTMRNHDADPTLNRLTGEIVDGIFRVRDELGVGLVEDVYKACLVEELRGRGLDAAREVPIPVVFRGRRVSKDRLADIVVEQRVVVEAKAVSELHPFHTAQTLTYLHLGRYDAALLVNFHAVPLRSGIRRFLPRG